MKTRIDAKELNRAIERLEKLCQCSVFDIEFEDRGRVKLSASDMAGRIIAITIYDASTAKMADITYTERL